MYSTDEQGSKIVYRDRLEDVSISMDRGQCLGLAGFEEPPAISWPGDFMSAFQHPLRTLPLRDLAQGAGRVAIHVSDSTRGVPTAKVMPMILEELSAAGIGPGDITVFVATGVHRPATEDEIRGIMGKEHLGGLPCVISHDPYDPGKLVYIGTTSYGTPVEVSRTVYEADFRITIGKVEPHEFAGLQVDQRDEL